MGCDEDVGFWKGVKCSIHSLEYGDVWQQPAGIPFLQSLFATEGKYPALSLGKAEKLTLHAVGVQKFKVIWPGKVMGKP